MKVLAWTAVAVLVGAGLARYWLAPGRPVPRGVVLGAALAVPLLGALELWYTVGQVRSPVGFDLWWRYASTTAHGHAVLWRSVAAALLSCAVVWLPRAWWPASALLGVWMLYGFSRLSHAAAMGGTAPLIVDLVHLTSAATWAGGVWFMAWGERGLEPQPGRGQERRRTQERGREQVERLSSLALWVVAVLVVTGVYGALAHASDPPRFFASGYFTALVVKLAAVAATLTLAAINRFVLVPRVRAGRSDGIGRALRVESVLLLGVLVATGWLTTSPVPHGDAVGMDALENARRVIDHLFR